MRPTGPAIAAAVVLMAQGVALAVIVAIELLALAGGDATTTTNGLALIALTVIAAVALGAFAVGTLRRASWARSGGIVFQVLGIALAVASLTIQPIPWGFTLSVGLPALAGFALLIAVVRRDGADDPRLHGRDG